VVHEHSIYPETQYVSNIFATLEDTRHAISKEAGFIWEGVIFPVIGLPGAGLFDRNGKMVSSVLHMAQGVALDKITVVPMTDKMTYALERRRLLQNFETFRWGCFSNETIATIMAFFGLEVIVGCPGEPTRAELLTQAEAQQFGVLTNAQLLSIEKLLQIENGLAE
jgi:hypothetical protein